MAGGVSTPNSTSRKRKASELNDSLGMNGHGSARKSKQASKKTGVKSSDVVTTPPYTVTVLGPAKHLPDGEKNNSARHTITIAKDFEVDYTVKPPSWWEVRQYKNLKLQDITFSIGSIVYINSRENIPDPPPADASDEEILRYDRQNLWVARILDIRALHDKAVFMLIAWLYWADELPMGRQPYHGDEEFILSNDLAIIDATTISSAADAQFWDEESDDMVASRPERFWRQHYDVGAWLKDKKGLSEVRKHCKCRRPQHPDHNMWHCGQEKCNTWNHEQCLIDEIAEQAWESRKAGKWAEFERQHQDKSFASRFLEPMRAVGKYLEEKAEQVLDDGVAAVKDETTVQPKIPTSPRKRGRPKKATNSNSVKPWKGILDVSLVYGDDTPLVARIQEIGSTKTLDVKVSCLVCGNPME